MNKKIRNKLLIEDIFFYLIEPFRYIYKKIKNKYQNIKYKNKIFKIKNKIYYKKNNQILEYKNYEDLFVDLIEDEYIYHYKINNNINYSRNFNKVLKQVFNYPETFKIPEEYINEYSQQQLNLIKKIKDKLLEIDYKDIYIEDKINYEECIKRNNKKYYYYDEYQKNKIEFDKIEKRIKTIINTIIITLLIWIFIFLTDTINIKYNKKPIFMLKKENTYYGLFYKGIESENDIRIGSYFLKNSKNNFQIIDNTKVCDQTLEKFYSDNKYNYYFNCIKSANVNIIYKNKKYNIKEALNNKIINIDDLKNRINFIKKIK